MGGFRFRGAEHRLRRTRRGGIGRPQLLAGAVRGKSSAGAAERRSSTGRDGFTSCNGGRARGTRSQSSSCPATSISRTMRAWLSEAIALPSFRSSHPACGLAESTGGSGRLPVKAGFTTFRARRRESACITQSRASRGLPPRRWWRFPTYGRSGTRSEAPEPISRFMCSRSCDLHLPSFLARMYIDEVCASSK